MVTRTTSLTRGTQDNTSSKAPKPENISYKYIPPLAAREDDLFETFFVKNNGNPDNIPYKSNQDNTSYKDPISLTNTPCCKGSQQ